MNNNTYNAIHELINFPDLMINFFKIFIFLHILAFIIYLMFRLLKAPLTDYGFSNEEDEDYIDCRKDPVEEVEEEIPDYTNNKKELNKEESSERLITKKW